jgi:ribosomal protein S18 acetylase RimI-like enzyme
VDGDAHGRGVGRALTAALITDARRAGIEVLTLDARGDNRSALRPYQSLGFTEYGRLPDFVAVGERRYEKVFYMVDLRQQDRSNSTRPHPTGPWAVWPGPRRSAPRAEPCTAEP